GGKNSLNRLIRCVCGKKIGPDPRNFNQRVNLGRNDLLIRTFLSCLNDDLTLLRIILPAKPDLNCVTRFGGVGLTPACEKGHLSIVKELLAHTEINVNQTNHVGWTPLLEAIVLNDGGIKQQAIVQLLLEHGASPHLTDKYGKTPLELARERGFEEIAQLLIAAGA
ncbi:ankyrin repeat domain-containing protein, partial [Escherichia coli]